MNMRQLVSFVTVEIDPVRPASQDCRHLDRAMLLKLSQDGNCVQLTTGFSGRAERVAIVKTLVRALRLQPYVMCR